MSNLLRCFVNAGSENIIQMSISTIPDLQYWRLNYVRIIEI